MRKISIVLTVLVLCSSVASAQQSPCSNIFDYDGDGNVVMFDFLQMLVLFGDKDEDLDGIWDSEDLCIDMTASNYAANPTEPCAGVGGPAFTCGTDNITHAGYSYATAQIGNQCWFAENCRYMPSVSPVATGSHFSPYYYVYDFDGTDLGAATATANYATYGTLYNFSAVTSGMVCPAGWHIPTDVEFAQLTSFLGGDAVAGTEMKATSGWSSNGNGTNSSGFTALPGGFRHYSGVYINITGNGFWWTSTTSGTNGAMSKVVHNYTPVVDLNFYGMESGFSARCLMD